VSQHVDRIKTTYAMKCINYYNNKWSSASASVDWNTNST